MLCQGWLGGGGGGNEFTLENVIARKGEMSKLDSRCCSILHVCALSTVLGRSIISVFPNVDHYAVIVHGYN